jgi:DNA mismatch repair ATPase MutS
LIELAESLAHTDGVEFRHFEANEDEGTLSFDFVLRPGVSDQRLGMRVLREEGVIDLVDRIPRKR